MESCNFEFYCAANGDFARGRSISPKPDGQINANLANFRFFLKSLGGFVALDKVDASQKTSAKSHKGSKAGF